MHVRKNPIYPSMIGIQLVVCFLCFLFSITSVCSFNLVCVSKQNKGILPIAEYEGSPRRFGHYQQDLPLHQYEYTPTSNQQHFERPPSSRKMLTSPTLFPPRPGFPKVHCIARRHHPSPLFNCSFPKINSFSA